MSEATYSLAILRHSSEKPVEVLVQDLLEVMGEASDPYLEYKLSESLLFSQNVTPVLESLSLVEADRLQQLFAQHKVETTSILIVNEDSEQAINQPYTCPACKHQQPGQIDSIDICKKCGAKDIHAEDPYQDEIDEVDKDTYALADSKKPANMTVILSSVAAVLVMGAGGYFAYNALNPFSEQATTIAEITNTPPKISPFKDPVAKPKPKPQTGRVLLVNTETNIATNTAIGAQGKSLPQGQAASKDTVVTSELEQTSTQTANLSASELSQLENILQTSLNTAFGDTDSGQYAQHLPKLKRLLELGKPELGIVFAEGVSDPYAAALLILEVAHSEQQQNHQQHHDTLLLTLKSVTVKTDSKSLSPLLTSSLSQAYSMVNDKASAATFLNTAIREAEDNAESTAQQIQWLIRMLVNHHHFDQADGAKQLSEKLQAIAANTTTDSTEDRLMVDKLYTHLAGVALQRGDKTAAAHWLKKIPAEHTRHYLLTSLDKLKTMKP